VAAPVAFEIVHNYFESVAPDQKNAPRLGLPRRRHSQVAPPETTAAPAEETER
jgi:hypothetical protein